VEHTSYIDNGPVRALKGYRRPQQPLAGGVVAKRRKKPCRPLYEAD